MPTKKNLSIALLTLGLAACGGGGGDNSLNTTTTGSNGSLRLALTDAPSCGYDAVNVTIKSLRVHKSASAADSDAGWADMVLAPARRINLLNLTNGVLEEMGQIPLSTGKYTQLRLVLADNDNLNPLANSVLPTGGVEAALKTPSGQQSGVKANIDIDIAANRMADFVVDFNACKSVVSAGNSGQYLLKPVVSVIPRYVSGVSGFVAGSLASASTSVSLQQGGVVIRATVPDTGGRFQLQPVAPGNYTLVMTSPGRATTVVTGVPVSPDSVTTLNNSGTALTSAVSATGLIQGNAPTNTLVRVLQPLTVGTSVEVAGKFVDGITGNYSYSAAVGAPMVAAYVPPPASLAFVADTAAAGKYTLAANLSGFPDKTAVLPVLAASAAITTNFTFP
ncbi:MAG: DUF4382 domain-containing protein [Rhodoferax sp.]|nr:DUF4382 domain-containing protein [Rhodoferax sp.]